MKNLKFYLMALTAIFLIGCGSDDSSAEGDDSRAEGKAKVAKYELEMGYVTMEEAECMAEVLSDYFSDDEKWATYLSLMDYTIEEQLALGEAIGERMAEGTASEEDRKLFDVSLESAATLPKITSECNIDVFELARKRNADLEASGL